MRIFGRRHEVVPREELEAKAARRKAFARRCAAFTLAISFLASAAFSVRYVLRESRLFALQQLLCDTTSERVSAEDLKKFIDFYTGRNLFTIDIADLRKNMLDHHWIADVRLKRVLPHTIEIHIKERRPTAVISLTNETGAEQAYFVDEKGFPFTPVTDETLALPRLTGFTREGFLTEEEKADALTKRLEEAVELIRLARERGGLDASRLKVIHYDAARGFTISLDQGRPQLSVGWFPFGDAFERYTLLAQALSDRAAKIESVDLTVQGRAVVKGLITGGKT